ncbi:sensor histidine kinase [Sporichthya polymorpha]|uniref:sensor histidine kinase n=1 Tax=Sporichthya polymorpha TaxID=35751 RepID=UPI0003A3EAD7|nr:PAS domain-containing sensor histidine kinase [Sporichthya polymorpha]
MASLTELVRASTDLDAADREWLQVLVADWQLLADLSFSDLVLWLPVRDGTGYLAAAQMRPTTGPTAFHDDLVGSFTARGHRPLLDIAHDEARIVREGDPELRSDVPVRMEAIPVRRAGRVLGVIARNTSLISVRTPSRLELTYIQCAADLARMIAAGLFPHVASTGSVSNVLQDGSPRVGDGLIRLDPDGVVTYASPNALSAYRRLGLATDLVGTHLGTVTAELAPTHGPVEEALAVVAGGRKPRGLEIETDDVVVGLRAIPLDSPEAHLGAIVLLRDVTDVRRRERELITKDATIREIHHRVKNNLQTVAALLRLQARRLTEPGARTALEEAVRRVGSIAIVHDTLSLSPDENLAFDEVVDRVLAMLSDVSSVEAGLLPRREGEFGTVAGELATPLSMVLTELLQNALEHGILPGSQVLVVRARRTPNEDGPGETLYVEVDDDGRGLPPDFDPVSSSNLGLQIVRTLVTGELSGDLEIGARPGGGTRVALTIPLRTRAH